MNAVQLNESQARTLRELGELGDEGISIIELGVCRNGGEFLLNLVELNRLKLSEGFMKQGDITYRISNLGKQVLPNYSSDSRSQQV